MHNRRGFLVLASLLIVTVSISLITANLLQRRSTREASFFSFQPGLAASRDQEPTFSLPDTGGTEETPEPPGQNCTYNISYWLEHADRWPEQAALGGLSFTRQEVDELLNAPKPEVYNTLFQQLYFTYLNIHHGASWSNIESTMNDANHWLMDHPPGSKLSEFNQQRGLQLASQLEDYNNGQIYPGPCPNQPPVQTATTTPVMNAILPTNPSRQSRLGRNPSPTTLPTNTPRPPENTPAPPKQPKPTDNPKPTSKPTNAPKPTKEPKPTKKSKSTDEPKPTKKPTKTSKPKDKP